jgi:DNA-binding HxlR family transcriptional regulator
MQRTSFGTMSCPIARGLERVGEWWSMLILRDAFAGMTRFDEFQKSLGIAPNMLTRRLTALVEAGLLERRRYSDHPPRDAYVLTARGRDFRTVLVAMFAWGNRHFVPEGESMRIVDARTGAPAEPMLVDRATLRPLAAPDFKIVAGPAARESTRRRLATVRGSLMHEPEIGPQGAPHGEPPPGNAAQGAPAPAQGART